MPHIKSGKLRAIAVGTRAAHSRVARRADRRRAGLQGLRDVAVVRHHRARGHAEARSSTSSTPRSTRRCASSAVTQRFADDNATAGVGSAEDFGAYIAKEQARWKEVVEKGKIRIE